MTKKQSLKIVVATQNPAKIQSVKDAFSFAFKDDVLDISSVAAQSGVSDQPLGDDETKQGALNRVSHAKTLQPDADFYVGLEAGIDDGFTYAWLVIEDNPIPPHPTKRGLSRSASLQLPPLVLEKVLEGSELGDVMDEIFHTENIKQKGGAISLLTRGLQSRSSVYQSALILALAPFLNHEHYQ